MYQPKKKAALAAIEGSGHRPAKGTWGLIGDEVVVGEIRKLLERVAGSEIPVLIRGEQGSGKERLARAIHEESPRARGPFVKVSCAALPEAVIESEIFGHEKGVFAGDFFRRGRLERAAGGTIFFDEVSDLPGGTQTLLVRAIQEGEFERLGGTDGLPAEARILAATSRNLEQLVGEGRFRSDLFYLLNVYPISVPPLRERRADIPLLAQHFVARLSRENGKKIPRIDPQVIELLLDYPWPGNVRELENCMERAVLLAAGEEIQCQHLPPALRPFEGGARAPSGTLRESLNRLERELIVEALKASGGNKALAARSLGISERLMGLRVLKHGLRPQSYRTKMLQRVTNHTSA